ncbi:uncharacterized protein LOC116296649 [Actinia tenebrosa]|uniref:Uncharacterized protein LOC116296649 n=1 Tax=Actinia tenebrosa TaxID=6105 RepID=A0A6P8HYT9_ACTTE|nr:uncharacterized protein LOC116296649 [Actinia tenebrosa]
MVQKTACMILCLLAGQVFAVTATSYNQCEVQEISKCDRVFTNTIRNADESQTLIDIYCNTYKVAGVDCLTSKPKCVGKIIDLLRFMVLQHMILDSKLGLCPNPDRLAPLRELVQANEKYRMKIAGLKELDADKFEPCTAKKNLYCASRFAEEVRNGGKAFHALTKFWDCYESKTMACDDQIYKDYVADVKTAGKKLRDFMKAFPVLIP